MKKKQLLLGALVAAALSSQSFAETYQASDYAESSSNDYQEVVSYGNTDDSSSSVYGEGSGEVKPTLVSASESSGGSPSFLKTSSRNAGSGFNYTYVEGGLGVTSADGPDVPGQDDPMFYYGRGSFAFGENMFVRGTAKQTTSENSTAKTETETLSLDLVGGMYLPVAASTDLYGVVGIINHDTDVTAGGTTANTSKSGGIAGVGVRHHLSESVDLETEVDYSRIDGVGDVSATMGGTFNVNENFQVGGAVDLDDASKGFRAMARMNFL